MKIKASSIFRYTKCAGSFFLEHMLTDQIINIHSPAAARGSMLHSMGETLLKEWVAGKSTATPTSLLKAQDMNPKSGEFDTCKNILTEYKKYFVALVKKRRKEFGNEVCCSIEKKIKKKIYGMDCVFMADAALITPTASGQHIDIIDLKTGNFDYIESAREQLLFSVHLLVLATYSTKSTVPITYMWHIAQPGYFDSSRAFVSEFGETSVDQSRGWILDLLEKLKAERNIYYFGDHCKFCPVLTLCPQKREFAVFTEQFMNKYIDRITEIDAEQLQHIWMQRESFINFLGAVDAHINFLMEHGGDFPKLYKKPVSGHRFWLDKELVKKKLKHLGDRLFEPQKLKSPAQVEILAGKQNIEGLWGKPTNYKIALRDGREAEGMFKPLDGESKKSE